MESSLLELLGELVLVLASSGCLEEDDLEYFQERLAELWCSLPAQEDEGP